MSHVKTSFLNDQRLPIVYEPSDPARREREPLLAWIRDNAGQVAEHLRVHGAILLRGFDIPDAPAFEQVSLALDPKLTTEYPGVTTRSRVTTYVHTSTELPPHYPIPQHAEMAYTPAPPRKVLFYCQQAPRFGGETPLCDLRKVWEDMPGPLRAKFEAGHVRYSRVHGAPSEGLFRFWGGRRWTDVFQTQDRAEVEKRAQAQALTVTWLPSGALRLENTLPPARVHPLHGTWAWHNHANLFHPYGPTVEYGYIARRQRTPRALAVNYALKFVTLVRRLFVPAQHYDWSVSYGDGSPITMPDLRQIYAVIWKHLACFRWQAGDVTLIDNFSVSHGRLPFHGERRILVSMTDSYAA